MEPTASGPTAKRPRADLQDAMLDKALSAKEPVSIYLVNGIRLHGHVLAMDRYTVLLSAGRPGAAIAQLVYKHAISTIAPERGDGR